MRSRLDRGRHPIGSRSRLPALLVLVVVVSLVVVVLLVVASLWRCLVAMVGTSLG